MGKAAWIFSLIILALIGVVVVWFFLGRTDLGPVGDELEKCSILEYKSDDGINIVFFADDKKSAQSYVDYFLGFGPFDENEESFNFYYIGGFQPECELYKGIAILCYSRELVEKSGSCPNDHIVVLDGDQDRTIRSSNYLNVMSINTKHPKSVLAHEFAHSFVNLAEEYVPAKVPRNCPCNCLGICDAFDGNNDGCYQGCSDGDLFRSVENGIMRTLKSDFYGKYNDLIIINKINNLAEGGPRGSVAFDPAASEPSRAPTGFVVGNNRNCREEEYFLFEADVVDEFNISDGKVVKGCFGDSGSGGFSYDVVLKDETKVFVGEFNPEEIFTAAPGDEQIDGDVFRSDKEFYIKAPIVENAEVLEVKDPEGVVVAEALVCGNNRGDANGDGVIEISDVGHIDSYLSGFGILNCGKNSDYNGDGVVDERDIDDLTGYIVDGKEPGIGDNSSEVELSSVCGDGVVDEREVCDGGVEVCDVGRVRSCLNDCSGFGECVSLNEGGFQELYVEDCNSVNDWDVVGNWTGFNGGCYVDSYGESSMHSSEIDLSSVSDANLSFSYTLELGIGEYFKVDVNDVEIFRVEGNKSGIGEIKLDVGGSSRIKGVCSLNVNSTGNCKWDDIKVSGYSSMENLGFFGKISGWIVKLFE
jgi:hypothetical protein